MQAWTLEKMLENLRVETGDSLNLAHGADEMRPAQIHLQNAQQEIYDEWEWKGFDVRHDLALKANQTLYEIPPELDFARTVNTFARYQDLWSPVEFGFTSAAFNISDAESKPGEGYDYDTQSDPVRRFDITYQNDRQMIEVWPRPRTDGTLRFEGKRKLKPLVNAGDLSDLDGLLIVLRAGAKILSRRRDENSQYLAGRLEKEAARRMSTLKSNNAGFGAQNWSIGRDETAPRRISIDRAPGY